MNTDKPTVTDSRNLASVDELRDIANRLSEISIRFMDTKVGNALSRLAFDVENVGSSIRAGKGI
jgi:hypothetical protein